MEVGFAANWTTVNRNQDITLAQTGVEKNAVARDGTNRQAAICKSTKVDMGTKVDAISAVTPVATSITIAITGIATVAVTVPHITTSLRVGIGVRGRVSPCVTVRCGRTIGRLALIRLILVSGLSCIAVLSRGILPSGGRKWSLAVSLPFAGCLCAFACLR
jgi:hypothetical protein